MEELREVLVAEETLDFKSTKVHGTDKQIAKLFSDYAKYSSEVQAPKNSKVNPHFKNKYAPLDEVIATVKPVLAKYNLAIIQFPTTEGNILYTNSILTHSDGAYITFERLGLPVDRNSSQAVGSCITYGRRYSISTIAGVSSEDDDDGNGAEPKQAPPQQKSTPTTKPSTTKATPKADDGLKAIIDEIDTTIREKIKLDSEKAKLAVQDVLGHGNYKKLDTVENGKKIMDSLNAIKGE